jgi:predicted RNase H-like nuclease (RuvC/YqgF family)
MEENKLSMVAELMDYWTRRENKEYAGEVCNLKGRLEEARQDARICSRMARDHVMRSADLERVIESQERLLRRQQNRINELKRKVRRLQRQIVNSDSDTDTDGSVVRTLEFDDIDM